MKIKPYVNKLHNSKEFKDFYKKNENAFIIAGFFIIDMESKKNIHQIDYYVPSTKKVAAFTLDEGINLQMLNLMNSKVPEKLDIATKIDLDALQGILQDEMKNRSITDEIKKIIAILQTVDGKKIWNLNCVLTGMGILRAHVDDDSQSVLKMEKVSMLDYIKRMNPADMQKMAGKPGVGSSMQISSNGMPQGGADEISEGEQIMPDAGSAPIVNKKLTKKEAEEQIKKLNQLEEAIEDEKKRLNGAIKKDSVKVVKTKKK